MDRSGRIKVHPCRGVTLLQFASGFGREGWGRRRWGWGLSSLWLETRRINKRPFLGTRRRRLEAGRVIYGRGDDSRGGTAELGADPQREPVPQAGLQWFGCSEIHPPENKEKFP